MTVCGVVVAVCGLTVMALFSALSSAESTGGAPPVGGAVLVSRALIERTLNDNARLRAALVEKSAELARARSGAGCT